MKRCEFKRWVGKVLVLGSQKGISVVYKWLLKEKIEECKGDDMNDECIDEIEEIECSIGGLIVGMIVWLWFDIWLWWVVGVVFGLLYVWYIMEQIMMRWFGKWDKENERYDDVSLEEEGEKNDKNVSYLEEGKGFGWIKQIKLRRQKK